MSPRAHVPKPVAKTAIARMAKNVRTVNASISKAVKRTKTVPRALGVVRPNKKASTNVCPSSPWANAAAALSCPGRSSAVTLA